MASELITTEVEYLEWAGKTIADLTAKIAKMQEKLENDLAWVYDQSVSDAATIARLCDERLDKSGAMLGRIRNISAALAIIEREEAEGR